MPRSPPARFVCVALEEHGCRPLVLFYRLVSPLATSPERGLGLLGPVSRLEKDLHFVFKNLGYGLGSWGVRVTWLNASQLG